MPREIDYVLLDNMYAAQRASLYTAGTDVFGLVPGEGVASDVMIICPPPTAQDIMKRRPAMGADGATLRSLMMLAGLHGVGGTVTLAGGEPWPCTPNCWLTNVVKYRMPGARNLTSMERNLIQPFLKTEWEAVGQPKVLVTVGYSTFATITHGMPTYTPKAEKPIRYVDFDGNERAVWCMMHQRMGISLPQYRDQIEQDWLDLGAWLIAGGWLTDDPAS